MDTGKGRTRVDRRRRRWIEDQFEVRFLNFKIAVTCSQFCAICECEKCDESGVMWGVGIIDGEVRDSLL